ncbi:SusC/RagA family TonB-linked outer membrane protein [Spirosoma montaniterrae]|uniref:SusC/RagA family TonB-linked outer membrane protein n=1 Tax=Spirosoma montaniterrae TaxID=1178516 RepID=A0A1P9WZL7_9BACT|nr:SusC/RagA family TonB-linked outer membrane protein [Spirosoma montaniterrae]AQG80820.1 SusC/RagA family TonB-linked outer membrane protein [Spirosoma montaniterrae]
MQLNLRCVLIVLLYLVTLGGAYAQDRTITGRVTSSDDNQPIPGASVVVRGTTRGTTTDATGTFRIQATRGQTLRVSFIGTTTQDVVVGNADVLNVTLKQEANALNEVVVTALGIKQEKRALGYSVQEVNGSELAQTQRENFLNALNGRVAGAMITPTSGNPGASTSIMLRGISSIGGNNQPLFVVDGLPISNNTFNQGALVSDSPNRNNDYQNRAADINPNDIESITILKGPEASALYGIDAASGAIVITTKKGTTGKGRITYDNAFRMEDAYRFPKFQTTFGPGDNGTFTTPTRLYFGPRYPSDIPMYDNIGNFFRTGFTQRHNLSLEGGTDKTTYRLSTAYTDQTGVIPVTQFKRLSVRLTGSTKISDKLEATGTLNYINTNNIKAGKGNGSTLLGLLFWPVTDNAQDYLNNDGTRRRLNPNSDAQDIDNPFFDINKNQNSDRNNRILGNVSLGYDAAPWLNLRGMVGVDVYSTIGNLLFHPQSNRAFSQRGSIENFTEVNEQFNGQFLATAKKQFGKISTQFLLGSALEDRRNNVDAVRGEQFYEPDFNGINNTPPTTQRAKNTLTRRRLLGVFGQLTLNYGDLIYLNVTGRNDWTSTLPIENRSFFYPSVSTSFVLTELPGLQGGKVLSFAKLRASFAEVGKDAPAYQTQSNLAAQVTTGGGLAYGVFGGNPFLRPERTRSYEVGADVRLFNGRLTADVAYFNRSAIDQISAPRLSYGTGFILQYINSGTIESRGVELQLGGNPVRSGNFNWDVLANFTRNNSTVKSLPADQPEFYIADTWLFSNVRNSLFVGQPATTFGGFDYVRNNNGDILINPTTGYPIKTTNFVNIGDRNPLFMIGLTNTFRYKNWNLSALLDIRRGGDVYNANELYLYSVGLSTRTLDRETPRVVQGVLRDGLENSANPTVNTIQVTPITRNDFYNTAFVESDFIEKGINWVRLRDVTLRYTLPQTMLSRQKLIKNASVFFTGTDLFLLTNYTGADPAVNGLNASTGGSGAAGFDYGTIAVPRGLSFGIQVSL